jgi:hypothetical protein
MIHTDNVSINPLLCIIIIEKQRDMILAVLPRLTLLAKVEAEIPPKA